MKVIEPGHIYTMDEIDVGIDEGRTRVNPQLVFVNREDNPHPGVQTQEVLRVLIDRTIHCDNCLPHPIDTNIIFHLRMALVLHEARALVRKAEKGLIEPENIAVGEDGHFALSKLTPTLESQNWVGRTGARKRVDDILNKLETEELHGVQSESYHHTPEPGGGENRSKK